MSALLEPTAVAVQQACALTLRVVLHAAVMRSHIHLTLITVHASVKTLFDFVLFLLSNKTLKIYMPLIC
jgi:hypothetical protein